MNFRPAMSFKSIRARYPSLRRLVFRINPNLFIRKLKIRKLLMGGDGVSGMTFTRVTGDRLLTVTPIADSPHAEFLRTYREIGKAIFELDQFVTTSYCKFALKGIEFFGAFFGHTDAQGVLQRAKSFADMYDGVFSPVYHRHQTPPEMPIQVVRIKHSDCYEVIDGHHRLAVAAVRGLDEYPCAILPTDDILTPMQLMVLESVVQSGRCTLLQPICSPELDTWSVERQCTDRLEMIMNWLKQRGISSGSFLDIGSSYGWFVSEMSKRGFQTSGVEQNGARATVGPVAYGLDPSAITAVNLGRFLRSPKQKYDVVCCLSVLHNYLIESEEISALEFIRLVDKITGSVLFFDTAECHESRYKRTLANWDANYIQKWLRENTSFSKIEILGTDNDRDGLYPVRYGRHLFACSRST